MEFPKETKAFEQDIKDFREMTNDVKKISASMKTLCADLDLCYKKLTEAVATLNLIAKQNIDIIKQAENSGEVALGVLEWCINTARRGLCNL